ncbi:MAG: response regulator transcription factor [Candidatus Competibacteraceae bacterium]|nr:response regulator transcription factor [Candidatus Competibacteraceae bacterium]MBK7985254.1 response regulator transcription factor [Candidatus Competibacteraceae bacterium]MBK8895670.1 response regulator transcription factor [Candidatus Competibacteraceae bacterium]MBK8962762.1 response regulator transcription factor [Candidatus Competibacteraceae bacterium]MBK9953306.1 response regulator transcription factor [Candidatus Competibacteraceae bacterium]
MRILLVDDHTLFREALLHVLKQFDSTAVVIEAATAQEAMRMAAHYHDLDLILLDLALPGASGLAALPELRELRPTVPLVILSASEEPLAVRQALKTGAMGYIPKSCSSHEMVSALRLVMAGEIYIPPALLAVLETVATAPDATVDPAAGAGGPETTAARALPARSPDPTSVSEEARFDGLTPRQLEVLRLMAQGLSNKSICKHLHVAEGTVKLHVTAVMRALKAANRTQAVLEATRLGLLAAAAKPD